MSPSSKEEAKDEFPKSPNDKESSPRISEDLRAFYAEHNVNVDQLISEDPNADLAQLSTRFIRLNPRFDDKEETLTRLSQEHGIRPLPVPWMEDNLDFYALPGNVSLAQSACYREGRIYGMDISSGAAVAVLLSSRYDKIEQDANSSTSAEESQKATEKEDIRVLDLCCAPGLKLCAMADYLLSNSSLQTANKTLVGVDISDSRIATCKRILHKYHISPETSGHGQNRHTSSRGQEGARIRVYCCDGTCFDRPESNQLPKLVFDSTAASEESSSCGKRKRMNKSARARERKRLKDIASMDFDSLSDSNGHGSKPSDSSSENASACWKAKLFDHVLVDAECSTDGSLKHIQKQMAKRSAKAVATKLTDTSKLLELVQLQKNLAACGFRLLKEGGTMVYSTCSLSRDQNENIVAWLLESFPDEAFLIPVEISSALSCETTGAPQITEGKFGVRFHPNFEVQGKQTSEETVWKPNDLFGGGFFLAKLGKRRKQSSP